MVFELSGLQELIIPPVKEYVQNSHTLRIFPMKIQERIRCLGVLPVTDELRCPVGVHCHSERVATLIDEHHVLPNFQICTFV